jgi:DNA-binding LacI/PurR family transcriptional regulator
METLLELPSPPTAVFVLNDMMAIGAISAARRKGYRVPDDISVIGFDDIELASAVNPALTTMAQPIQSIAQIATERLLEKMNSRDLDWENEQFILSAQLVVRESTAVWEN